jgi:putative ABC transport system permease protein
MTGFVQDLRHALRQLRQSPGFTAVAVLTLALGIGASTAMFSVLNAVLLRPLPFTHSDRLVRILSIDGNRVTGPSPLDVRDFASQNRTFEKLAIYDSGWRKNVSALPGSAEPEQMPVGLMSADYFEVLGIKPIMGRLFRDEENQWGNQFEVLLSYEFWQSRFGGDRTILGKSIRINDEPYTVIGIVPAGLPDASFDSKHGKVELWTPFIPYLSAGDTVWDESARGERGFWTIGRLKPGVSMQQAAADLRRVAQNLADQYPLDRGVGVKLQSLQEDRAGTLRPLILLLMGAVLLILLIACSNVANLLLARNSGRTREIALRLAMGAQNLRMLRQFITENLTLGLVGGILGCGLAWWGCAILKRVHPVQLPQLATLNIDFYVLAFAFGLSMLSSVFFGSVPALTSLKVSPLQALNEASRTNTGSKTRKRLGRLFVTSEVAFAVMLLIGTGLLVQSILRLQEQDAGFRSDHLLRTHIFLPPVRYPNSASITRFARDYADRVSRLPGVEDVTISAAYPPVDNWLQNFAIAGRAASSLQNMPSAFFNVTDPEYLHTFGIPLLQGRNFSEFDTETSPPVALINEAMAKAYFPNEDPIGKQVQVIVRPVPAPIGNLRFTIVGVMGDAMNLGLALPPAPQLTTLFRQTPDMNFGFKNLIVRTTLDPMQLAPSIRQQLHSIDPDVPFAEVSSMDDVMKQETADRRYTTGLLALFAACGVVLALIGVYGVISYVVAQGTSEIGLRIAVGARPANVLWMVLKQGIVMAVVGAAAGILGAIILRRALAPLVFGISPNDPVTFSFAAALIILFAVAASFGPALKATKVDPIVALRYE